MYDGPICDFSETKTERAVILRVTGHANYLHCKPLKKFLDRHAQPTVSEPVVLEFSHCKSMDSTVLGLIAQAAIRITVEGRPMLVLANLTGGPRRAVVQLGLTHLARIEERPELTSDIVEVTRMSKAPLDPDSIRSAHEALVKANPANQSIFSDFLSFTTPQTLH